MSDFELLQFDIFFYQAWAVTLAVSKAFELATDLHKEKAIILDLTKKLLVFKNNFFSDRFTFL